MATAQETKLETETDKVSYLIGRNIGGSIAGDDLGLNIDNLVAGLREAIDGKDSQIKDADAQVIMQNFQKIMEGKAAAKAAAAQAEAAKAGEANAAAGKKFLEENKTRDGVTVTASGLQYEVLKAGEGAKPKATDTVSVHYHGTLIDGTVFDSSVDRGTPAEFPLNQVISGWTEGLQLMGTGSKWKFFIPSDLAYGDRGAPGSPIAPGSMLTFEVELLEIKTQ